MYALKSPVASKPKTVPHVRPLLAHVGKLSVPHICPPLADVGTQIRRFPPKHRGELGEARFLAKAMSLGFTVAKPFGDSARYDFLLDWRGRVSRVQVKSAWTRSRTGYQFGTAPCKTKRDGLRPYRRSELDFLACYVAPEDAWFIFPVSFVLKRNHLTIRNTDAPWIARYRDDWHKLCR